MNRSSLSGASLGLVFVAISAVLFGTIGVVTKGIFNVSATNALSITLLRGLIALPVLLVISLALLRGRFFKIAWRDLRIMIAAGLLMALYQVTFVLAVQLINVTIVTLVTLCTLPIMVAFLARALLGERLSQNVLIALGLALVGVVLLVGFQPIDDLGPNAVLGIALALLTALSSALFQVSSRALANRYHPMQTLTVYFAVVVLAVTPFALGNGFVTSYPPVGWLLFIQLSIGASVLGYGFLLLGLRTTPATTATIVGLLEPLTGTILAAILLGERLGTLGIFGAALMLAAMVIVFRGQTQPIAPEFEVP